MTDISPAAQAVWHAAWSNTEVRCGDIEGTRKLQIAAALRALAHHQHPAWNGTGPACHWTPTPHTRRELLNLANEIDPPVT
jgi:hypothetical protein